MESQLKNNIVIEKKSEIFNNYTHSNKKSYTTKPTQSYNPSIESSKNPSMIIPNSARAVFAVKESAHSPSNSRKNTLDPINSHIVKQRKRSLIIDKNCKLQVLIEKFFEDNKKIEEVRFESFEKPKENYDIQKSICRFCQNEVKSYHLNLPRNLKIEKIRIDNNRRHRMRNILALESF